MVPKVLASNGGIQTTTLPVVTDRLGLLMLRDFRLRFAPSQPFVSLL